MFSKTYKAVKTLRLSFMNEHGLINKDTITMNEGEEFVVEFRKVPRRRILVFNETEYLLVRKEISMLTCQGYLKYVSTVFTQSNA